MVKTEIKKYLLTISGILFLTLVLSLIKADLVISPGTLPVDVNVNTAKTFTINMTNTYTFPIYNVLFPDLPGFTFSNISQFNPNETKIVTITVLTDHSYASNLISNVRFLYVVDIPVEITTYKVNITGTNFNPNNITIRNGDTVQWSNGDDISHTVTASNFELNIQPGQSGSRTFNTVGSFPYQDTAMFWGGQVNVINRSDLNFVHSGIIKIFQVNINSISNPTNISASVPFNNFTVSVIGSDTVKGTLYITNTGSQVAERISLSDSLGWLKFDENNFNIQSGQSQPYPVTFKIQPKLTNTNDTDKTYNITLKVKASNSGESDTNILVYVPYSNIFDINDTSNIGYINYLKNVFCPVYPTSFLCNQTIGNSTNPQIIYRDSNITINDAASEWEAFKKKVGLLADSSERTNNQITSVTDSIDQRLTNLESNSNSTLTQAQKDKAGYSSTINGIFIVALGLIASACIFTVWFFVDKRRKNKALIEGKIVT